MGNLSEEINSSFTPKPQRILKDWIQSYVDWVTPRVRVPPQYTAWCACFAIASALERRVKIPRKYLGGFDCDAFLFIMLIGDPGIGKGVSMKQVQHLLDRVPLNIGENVFTKERLFQQLMEFPRSAVYLILGEFSEVLQKNKNEVFELLLRLYDGDKRLMEGTRARGRETVNNPSLNFIAGTTSPWIVENITNGIIGGGLPSRICWVYADPDEAGELKIFYHKDTIIEDFTTLEDNLAHDLNIIASMEGDMKITSGAAYNKTDPDLASYGDEDACAWFEHWCRSNKIPHLEDANMQNFFARKRTHLHKLAMIRSISLRDDLVISISDYQFAINAIERTEKKVHKVLGKMGKNIYMEDTARMYAYVIEHGPVEDAELRRVFESSADPRRLNDLILGMEVAQRIMTIPKGGKKFWVSKEAFDLITLTSVRESTGHESPRHHE